jgi:hypothetical protein
VDTLFEALTWVDQYAQSGAAGRYQEYRIRVEKDEAVIPTLLSCGHDGSINRNRADYVCFTLRGHGQERIITKVPGIHRTVYMIASAGSVSALIQVGYGSKHIALRLGENIRIDAQRELYPGIHGDYSGGGWENRIIDIEPNSMLTMEKGSTLANHSGIAVWMPHVKRFIDGVIYDDPAGLFELKGGTITNCGAPIQLANEHTDVLGYTTKPFRFYSGSIVNNSNGGAYGQYDNLIGIAQSMTSDGRTHYAYFPYTYFAVDG